MSELLTIAEVLPARPTLEGAGVRLHRAFGFAEAPRFDPFLLLDDIHSEDPADYTAGFPWHPHRGIETVTYVLEGDVEHGDSLGNRGSIGSGDVQWMTAGGGIIHQEMPQAKRGDWRGLQLWVNLPRADKMTAPRYRDVSADRVPEVALEGGGRVKVIAGRFQGMAGPVHDIVRAPVYLDVDLPAGQSFRWATDPTHHVSAYVLTGAVRFGAAGTVVRAKHAVRFEGQGAALAEAGAQGGRFLLFSGEPLREPVAWRGPIVMNTEEELDRAFEEYRAGTFVNQPG